MVSETETGGWDEVWRDYLCFLEDTPDNRMGVKGLLGDKFIQQFGVIRVRLTAIPEVLIELLNNPEYGAKIDYSKVGGALTRVGDKFGESVLEDINLRTKEGTLEGADEDDKSGARPSAEAATGAGAGSSGIPTARASTGSLDDASMIGGVGQDFTETSEKPGAAAGTPDFFHSGEFKPGEPAKRQRITELSDRVVSAVGGLSSIDVESPSEFSHQKFSFAPYITLSRLDPEERSQVFEHAGDNLLKRGSSLVTVLKAYIAAGKRDKITNVLVQYIMSGASNDPSGSYWMDTASTLIGLGFEAEVKSAVQELSSGEYLEAILNVLTSVGISQAIIDIGKRVGSTEDLERLKGELEKNKSSLVKAAEEAIEESRVINEALEVYHRDGEDALFKAAKSLFYQKDYATSLIYYAVLIERSPRHPWACYDMGHVFLKLGDSSSAIDCFERAVEVNPENAYVHADFAYAFIKEGDKDMARIELIVALEKESGNKYAISLLGPLPQAPEMEELGDREYEKALELEDKARIEGLRSTAIAYMAAGAEKKVIHLLEEHAACLAGHDIEYIVTNVHTTQALAALKTLGLTLANAPEYESRMLAIPILKRTGDTQALINIGDVYLYDDEPVWAASRLAYEAANHQVGLERLNQKFEDEFIFIKDRSNDSG